MIKVDVDKIIPVTEARDTLNKIIDDVSENKDSAWVLTKNGTPTAFIAGIDNLEDFTGGKPDKPTSTTADNQEDAKKEDIKEPKVEVETKAEADKTTTTEEPKKPLFPPTIEPLKPVDDSTKPKESDTLTKTVTPSMPMNNATPETTPPTTTTDSTAASENNTTTPDANDDLFSDFDDAELPAPPSKDEGPKSIFAEDDASTPTTSTTLPTSATTADEGITTPSTPNNPTPISDTSFLDKSESINDTSASKPLEPLTTPTSPMPTETSTTLPGSVDNTANTTNDAAPKMDFNQFISPSSDKTGLADLPNTPLPPVAPTPNETPTPMPSTNTNTFDTRTSGTPASNNSGGSAPATSQNHPNYTFDTTPQPNNNSATPTPPPVNP